MMVTKAGASPIDIEAGVLIIGGGMAAAWAAVSAARAGADGIARPVGAAALRPAGSVHRSEDPAAIAIVQAQMLPYDKVLWREKAALAASQRVLDELWRTLAAHRRAEGLEQVGARETAALIATARWCTAAALAREESRGMHGRSDAPGLSPGGAPTARRWARSPVDAPETPEGGGFGKGRASPAPAQTAA